MKLSTIKRSAKLSDCGHYRYTLRRAWHLNRADKSTTITFIGLNPSTADASIDDPTLRRCMSFSDKWGYKTLYMVNLFGYRATDPKKLYTCIDPVGIDNDKYIKAAIRKSSMVIACWGEHGNLLSRDKAVNTRYSEKLHSLRINKSGQPAHPLYLSATVKPSKYQRP